jgi:hypothetical protein
MFARYLSLVTCRLQPVTCEVLCVCDEWEARAAALAVMARATASQLDGMELHSAAQMYLV